MKTIEKCAFCGGELKSGKSSITTHKTSDYEYTVFNEPYLECIKCRGCFSADPDQDSKTSKFMGFLALMGLKKAEIEYSDMIRSVDDILK